MNLEEELMVAPEGDREGGAGSPEALVTERLSAGGTEGVAGILRAAALLREGRIVAFPTETVYGLGANALDAAAVAKVFAAKRRPGWDPLIVHVDGREMLQRVAMVSARAERLMAAFWPGPLTLLLPRTSAVPDAVTSGRALVGVRMPDHVVAREVIRQAGAPVAAPSANLFGRPSPTTAAHVLADLDGRIDAVLDGGATSVGLESTVFDVEAMAIYRPGAVTAEKISRVVGEEARVMAGETAGGGGVPEGLASPGLGMRHYAPRARLVLVEGQVELLRAIGGQAGEVGVMLPDGWDARGAAEVFRWGPWGDATVLAQRLFAGLRRLDESGVGVIVCPVPEMRGLGEALRDRLEKAARVE